MDDVKIVESGKRKTIGLQVQPSGRIVVRVPRRTPLSVVNDVLEKKRAWLEKNVRAARRREPVKKGFVEGEGFLYLGKKYPMKFVDRTDRVQQEAELYLDDYYYLDVPARDRARELFEAWYREHAKTVIDERVAWYGRFDDFEFNEVKISWAKKRWGSCTAKRNLNFNWRIVMAPLEIIDYLVVHELCHLTEANHSRRYWAEVEKILPDYQERRQWLKEHGHRLSI